MKTSPENETSPNHTWTPDAFFPPCTRVQWRKDSARLCAEQNKATQNMWEAIGQNNRLWK